MRHLLFAACALTAMGCASNIGSQSDFTTDTFATPTEHGELMMGNVSNEARFDASHRFHSWTFTLSDDADLDLRTSIATTNLDTVMFLYRREGADQSWGAFERKNDDVEEGDLSSRIAGTFPKGEYRIKVRAAKTAQIGDFVVRGACDGAGCPTVDQCVAGYTFPANTDFTEQCELKLYRALTTATQSEKWGHDDYADRCERGELVAKAIDYAHTYWTEDSDLWHVWENVEPNGEVNFELFDKGQWGAVLRVTLDSFDAEQLTFVFDDNNDLVAYLDKDEFVGWTCGEPGESAIEAPPAMCVSEAVWGLTHDPIDSWDNTYSLTVNEMLAGDQDDMVAFAMIHFADFHDLGYDAELDVNAERWTALEHYEGGTVTVAHDDTVNVYDVVSTDNGRRIISRDGSEGLSYLCEGI